LNHIGKIEPTSQSFIQMPLGNDVKIGAESLQEFPLGNVVARFGSL
jgi:hypothetical protein